MTTPSTRIVLEVCVASTSDAIIAVESGADRLELNLALELGGLTPSPTLVRQIRSEVSVPLIGMVRPRGGGFCYSAREKELMLAEAESLLEAGVQGLASGALTADGRLDFEFWERLRKVAAGCETVFHRAIDVASDSDSVFCQLIELQTTRVLTSGQKTTAVEGIPTLADWNSRYGSRIQILAGAGVAATHVDRLILEGRCRQLHGSFSVQATDPAAPVAAGNYPRVCGEKIRRVREAIDQWSENGSGAG